ncbi:Meiotically up-regulated gene 51 protein [Candida viswanathii]|uniref:Meiotically up-regulated gene 51 protein n=1 Tax=Candida viswanathii TaxID=5486 RepID=A0A367XNE0_9ASCO|nr:Meiotically up-regulated gene 51 protein [Candida viswanathii]
MALQYSPAKTSKISKKPSALSKSPIKKFQKDVKKIILPTTRVYDNKVSKQQRLESPRPENALQDKLVIKDYNVQLDYQLSSKQDIIIAIDTILENRWSEHTKLHHRYPTTGATTEERLLNLKGISQKFKIEIIRFRRNIPDSLVTTTQLYSIFLNQNNTFVDKSLELNIRQGKLRRFVISNASPVILRSISKFQQNKVTYGFENVDLIVKTEAYFKLIQDAKTSLQEDLQDEQLPDSLRGKKTVALSSLTKFHKYLQHSPAAISMTSGSGDLTQEETTHLMNSGFLTLASNHLNEIESNEYAISYPSCGTYLKLVNAGRSWLVKTLSKLKFKELVEDQIVSKWQGINPQGDSKMNNFRSPFYGYDLNWVLADALGAGVIEVFNTPVGRGWRLTGKV